jgi:hypothetical protein
MRVSRAHRLVSEGILQTDHSRASKDESVSSIWPLDMAPSFLARR